MFPLVAVLCLCVLLVRGGLGAECRGLPVTLTAYASGTRTASGLRPGPRMLALSRDLELDFGAHFGDRLTISGLGVWTFEDRMPSYWRRRVDLYLPPRERALHFGKRDGVLYILSSHCP